MNLVEALDILKKEIPGYKPTICKEWKAFYVFFLSEKAFNGIVAIRKSDKKIVPFTPTLIPLKEIKNYTTHKIPQEKNRGK